MTIELSELKINQIINLVSLIEMFKCSHVGRMRRSLRTNSLVLISDETKNDYDPLWKDHNNLLHFQGMGKGNSQTLTYYQNKTLSLSNSNGVNVFLFKVESEDKYQFLGRVLLASDPYSKKKFNKEKVYFPLFQVKNQISIIDLLSSIGEDKLIELNILDKYNRLLGTFSVNRLIEYMKEKGIDTLIGPGGWFITNAGFYCNNNAKGKKLGNVHENSSLKAVFEKQNKYLNPFYKGSIVQKRDKEEKFSSFVPDKIEGNFRLISFNFQIEESAETSINFLRINNFVNEERPFTTLLIGSNATGKSTILSLIQKVFLELYNLKESKSENLIGRTSYSLTFSLDEKRYSIQCEKSVYKFFSGKKEISIYELPLPSKLIVSSFLLSDRFTFNKFDPDANGKYEYLGVKSTNNAVMLGTAQRNLLTNILFQSANKEGFLDDVKLVTKFLDFKPYLKLQFKGAFSTVDPNVTDLPKDMLLDLIDLINMINIPENKSIYELKNDELTINIDLNDSSKYSLLSDSFKFLFELTKTSFIKHATVHVRKFDKFFSIEEASSGENHFFSTMVNILSRINNSSLIIIDEPEVSLHPNWQYKYLNGLMEIFQNYQSCHFLIATHSHFMVSDLQPHSSSIVALKKNKEKMSVELLNEKPYGWSTEAILYNIFNMKTTRNHYLEMDIRKLIILLRDGSPNINQINDLLSKLKELNLLEDDPLNLILEKARSHIEKNV